MFRCSVERVVSHKSNTSSIGTTSERLTNANAMKRDCACRVNAKEQVKTEVSVSHIYMILDGFVYQDADKKMQMLVVLAINPA